MLSHGLALIVDTTFVADLGEVTTYFFGVTVRIAYESICSDFSSSEPEDYRSVNVFEINSAGYYRSEQFDVSSARFRLTSPSAMVSFSAVASIMVELACLKSKTRIGFSGSRRPAWSYF